MTHPNAIRGIAQHIANECLKGIDFSTVYEDEDIQYLTDDELVQVHDLVIGAKAVLPSE